MCLVCFIAAYYIGGGDLVWVLASGSRPSRERNVRGFGWYYGGRVIGMRCEGVLEREGEVQKSKAMHCAFR